MNNKESKFFQRRVNIDKIRMYLPFFKSEVFHETKTFEQFKFELVLRVVEHILHKDHDLGWDELNDVEETEFVNKVAEQLDDIIRLYYKNTK